MPRGRLVLFDGAKLRALRHARDLSLTEVAALIDAQPASVGRWESGAQKPDPRAAQALAAMFAVPVLELTALTSYDDPRVGLAELRMLRGLTGAEAAVELGVTRKQLSGYENGQQPPDALIGDLARLYRVTPGHVQAAIDRGHQRWQASLDDARQRARGTAS